MKNVTSLEGHKLGEALARFCDEAEPKARLRMPELPPRCASCAYRAGSHLANGSPATVMTALKCAMEGVEFYCHDIHREGALCSGWSMFALALDGPEDLRKAPWDFIDGHDDAVEDERVLLIETFDLRDPCCPIAVVEPYGIVMEPADRSSADAIARFERAGGVVLRDGTITMPKTGGMKR